MRTPILFVALFAAALVVDTTPGVSVAATPSAAHVASAAATSAPATAEQVVTLDVLELI